MLLAAWSIGRKVAPPCASALEVAFQHAFACRLPQKQMSSLICLARCYVLIFQTRSSTTALRQTSGDQDSVIHPILGFDDIATARIAIRSRAWQSGFPWMSDDESEKYEDFMKIL